MTTERPIMGSPPGAETVIDGQRYLYFGGTSYLGLHGHPDVLKAACDATMQYGVHTATSRARYGNSPPTLEVEARAAEFFGRDAAFYFVSGYLGNSILVHALGPDFDVVLADEVAHYSVLDAAALAGKPVWTFATGDADALATTLRERLSPGQRPLVMSDGVFASSGRIAPVADYREVLANYAGATILLDDAHGFMAYGAAGRGSYDQAGLWREVNRTDTDGVRLIVCGTLSKAAGGFGGLIPGDAKFVERARTSSHYYDGASAPPIAAAAASAKSLEIVASRPELRRRLADNVGRVRAGLRRLGLPIDDLPTPIISIETGSAADMSHIHTELRRAGIILPYVSSYSGVGAAGSLRLAVFATHTEAMIDRLLAELAKCV